MQALCAYAWPGNIRELDNRIQRGAALTSEGDIDAPALFSDLPSAQTGHASGPHTAVNPDPESIENAFAPAPEVSSRSERHQTSTGTGNFRRSAARELRDHLRDGGTVDLQEECDRFERQLLEAVLTATEGNQVEAAKRLELSPRQMRYKVKQHGLR